MIRLACILGIVGVAGCVSSPPAPQWVNTGTGVDAQFAQVKLDCLQKAQLAIPTHDADGRVVTTNFDLFYVCMGAKGWAYR